MADDVASGWVRLTCSDPKFDRTFRLGVDPPKVSGGVGGWEIVTRPRQVGMTVWQGVEPYTLELPILMDGYGRRRHSQEPAIRELLAAGRGDDESEPSTWEIQGLPWSLGTEVDEWVLNGAEPNEQVLRRTGDFSRVRQGYTLTFVEYVPPELVSIRRKARQGAKGKTTLYTVRRGDTPAGIARRRRCQWKDLRQLNPGVVKSANQNLKDGSRIRVPVLKKAKARKR